MADETENQTPEAEEGAETVSAPEGPVAPAAEPPVEEAQTETPPEPEPEPDAAAEATVVDAEAAAAEAPAQPEPKKKRKRIPRAQRRQRSKPKRERPAERKPITRLEKPEHARCRRQERRGVVVASAMD